MKQHHWFYERGPGDKDLRPLTVRAMMSPTPVTLGPEDLVLDAMRVMREKDVRHLPVIRADGKLAGLVTESDILRQVLHGKAMTPEERYHGTLDVMLPLERVMVKDVAVLRPADSVATAVALFLERKIRCAPVVDDARKLLGIVTETDLMVLLKHMVE